MSVLFTLQCLIYFQPVNEINLYQTGIIDATIPFPADWNDFTLEELHMVAQNILTYFDTAHQAQAGLFLKLLTHRCNKVAPNIMKELDAEDAVINGMPAIDFIYKENNLTKQPYPILSLTTSAAPMYGPEDDFNNLTCGEFEDCEIFFNQFVVDTDPELLTKLASVLYRPKNVKYLAFNPQTHGFDRYDAETMAPRFKKLSAWELYTIFLWYAGCRAQLPKIFPNCFGAAKAPGEETREPDYLIFTKCIHAAAGAKNGSRSEIRCMLLKELFFDIELQNIENQELQNQIDNAR